MSTAFSNDNFMNALLQINRMKAALIFEECYVNDKSFRSLESMTIDALERIGTGWQSGKYSLAQVYMSGLICEELVELYLPRLNVQRKDKPRIAIGVLMDHHALGKRMVYSLLRASGYEIQDFGVGLSVEDLVQKTADNQIDILLISTLMLPSALKIEQVRELMNEKNIAVKIVVGGAPFRLDETLWKTVGADAFGKTASDIIPIIEQMSKGVK